MPSDASYLIKLAAFLGRSVGDSATLFTSFHTDALGFTLPHDVLRAPAVVAALNQAEVSANGVRDAAVAVDAAAASDSELETLTALISFGLALAAFYSALNSLVTAVQGAITPVTVPDQIARTAARDFADELAKPLGDYIIAAAITNGAPKFAFLLKLAGLLDWRYVPPDLLSPNYVKKTLQLERLKDLMTNPSAHLSSSLGWGAANFDPADFFRLTSEFLPRETDFELGTDAGDPFLRIGSFKIQRDRSPTPPGLLATLVGKLDADREDPIKATDEWDFVLSSNLRLIGSASAQVTPPLTINLQLLPPATGEISGELRTFFERNESARPVDLLSGTGLLSLSANNVVGGVGLKAEWDTTSRRATINPLFFAEIQGASLKIGSSGADSFIGTLLAGIEIEAQFDLGFEWSPNTGLRITSSGGVEIALPIHRQIGPLEFKVLYLALTVQDDGTLSLEVSAALAGALGPLTAVVDRIGVILELKFVEGTDAPFRPFDLALRFKPPRGIGLGIDAGVVKGGGYVDINVEEGAYAGILTLTIAEFLSVTAIGLINTRLPGGQPGFSLLLIITAEFVPGVQLGYGFTLSGVGGLLGLNRAMLLDPLAERVRTGAVNSILFPTNVIANATRIISDLRAIFPPQEGTFLIGPMAKIGWGTPNLISVSLGIIIEIPGDVVILGRIRSALPIEQAPVLVLQVTFVGALEFTKRRLWFYATLFESQLLFIPLEGEMGLLMDFSDNPNFVLSVGGFHPDFRPPPLPFPTPARVGMSLINESDARIRAEAYFAVTTNSVQMGCSLDALFRFDAFNVDGEVSFDAILRFSPFHLEANLSAQFNVDVLGIAVFSVHLRGSIEGPTPWRVRGTAEIDTPLYKQSIDVDIPFGEERSDRLPSIAVLPQMKLEFEKQESWRTTLPAVGQLFVNLRKLDEPDLLVLHPIGTLQISQRFAPLNLLLSKIGNQEPSDVKKISVSVQAGQPGKLGEKGPMREKFSVGQFRDLSDAARLSAAAFEPMDSGLELAAAGQSWTTGPGAKRSVRHEQVVLDSAFDPEPPRLVAIPSSIYWHHAAGAAVCRAAVSLTNRQLLQPFASKITTSADQFAMAYQANNQPVPGRSLSSYAEAESRLAEDMEADPSLSGTVHIIPSAEVAIAG
ncbi:MAG: hypothetical protein H7Z16_00240 [Pyrinomonadaceae bacterium]|nr:hypothetical protein [Pyrinomonadaceae bacterium]